MILDWPSFYEQIVTKGQAIAESLNADYYFVECADPGLTVLNNRLAARGRMRSQPPELAVETYRAVSTIAPATGVITVTTTDRTAAACAAEVLRQIGSKVADIPGYSASTSG